MEASDKEIELELRERRLWHSFIAGTGVLVDRTENEIDVFIRLDDGYVWVKTKDNSIANELLEALSNGNI